MTKTQKRDIATSATTLTFIVIALSGVMMFFHFFDNYVKELHEILGLVFVLSVVFHVVFNWKSMKNYFNKKIFLIAASFIFLIASGFILNVNSEGKNPKIVMMDSVLNAPIEKSFALFSDDIELIKTKLLEKNIEIENLKSIKEIASKNRVSPFHIIELIN